MRHVAAFGLMGLLLAGCPPKNPEGTGAVTDADTDTTVGMTAEELEAKRQADEAAAADEAKMQELGNTETPLHERVNGATELMTSSDGARKALEVLQSIQADNPDSAEVEFNIGVAKYYMLDVAGARRSFEKALDMDPKLSTSYLYLGVLDERDGNLDAAVSRYREGVRVDEENKEIWGALVGALRKQGRLDAAVAEAKSALKINTQNLSVYNNLGLVYLDKGEHNLAKFVFVKAINSIPGAEQNPYIQANLGRVYFDLEEYHTAQFHLEKSVELNPELTPSLVYLSQLYLDNRNYKKMVPLLETARKLEPDNQQVLINLGIAYRGVGRLDDAEATYKAALELDPADPAPHFNLGILYGDYKKDYESSLTSFTAYVDAGGEDAETATEYIEDVEKEKSRAEKKAKRDAERKKREEEKKKREELLKAAEEKAAQDEAAGAGDATPTDGTPPADGGAAGQPADEAPPQDPPADDPPADEPPADAPPADDAPSDDPWGAGGGDAGGGRRRPTKPPPKKKSIHGEETDGTPCPNGTRDVAGSPGGESCTGQEAPGVRGHGHRG